eukprot:3341738-Alexandrium_andersonii.AAC.1
MKSLIIFLAEFAPTLASVDEAGRLAQCCIYSLAKLIHIMDTNGPWLGEAVASEAEGMGRLFLQAYSKLARHSAESHQR